MRSLVVTVVGILLLISAVDAQSLAEHAAAAAGASIGTAAGKPMSDAITKIFGAVDNDAKKAAKSDAKGQKPAPQHDPANGIASPDQPLGNVGSTAGRRSATRSEQPEEPVAVRQFSVARQPAVYAPPAPPEPPRRDPTPEELASIQVGATEKQMLGTLGQPNSRVTIPDDDHLIEICQYWANGKPAATFRVDNGQVISIEQKSQN